MKYIKCGGLMETGSVHGDFRVLKEGDLYGDVVKALYCKDCGFVELYKEPSSREPWRWLKEEETKSSVEKQRHLEEEQHRETSRNRLIR